MAAEMTFIYFYIVGAVITTIYLFETDRMKRELGAPPIVICLFHTVFFWPVCVAIELAELRNKIK
jgi:hypothetical protein